MAPKSIINWYPSVINYRSGDQVEIITSNKQKPSEDWLGFVVTAKARGRIKDALKEEKKKIADEGKYTVQRKLEGIGATFNQHNIDELVHYYKLQSNLDLFYQVAVKNIDLKEIKEFKVTGDKIEAPRPEKTVQEFKQEISVHQQAVSQKRCRADHFW